MGRFEAIADDEGKMKDAMTEDSLAWKDAGFDIKTSWNKGKKVGDEVKTRKGISKGKKKKVVKRTGGTTKEISAGGGEGATNEYGAGAEEKAWDEDEVAGNEIEERGRDDLEEAGVGNEDGMGMRDWDVDEEAMNGLDWMGEDHWIVKAVEYWKGPRKEGRVAYETLKAKDRAVGEELRRAARGIRDKMGID